MTDVNKNTDLDQGEGIDKQKPTVDETQNEAQGHMGATESDPDEVRKTKPPTQSMAELTNKKGQATPPDPEEFNPGDMITPG
jgi:hypothetical protein